MTVLTHLFNQFFVLPQVLWHYLDTLSIIYSLSGLLGLFAILSKLETITREITYLNMLHSLSFLHS